MSKLLLSISNINPICNYIENIYKIKDYVIGGSVSLILYGLIDRPVHDIDIFVYDEKSFQYDIKTEKRKNCRHELIQMIDYHTHIELFKVLTGKIPYYNYYVHGRMIKLVDPFVTLYMKRFYGIQKGDLSCWQKVANLQLGDIQYL